jgi:hypothetical protein
MDRWTNERGLFVEDDIREENLGEWRMVGLSGDDGHARVGLWQHPDGSRFVAIGAISALSTDQAAQLAKVLLDAAKASLITEASTSEVHDDV